MHETEDFNELASQAIAERRWSEAHDLLENALARMPDGWNAAQEDATSLQIAFWDQEEFFAYVGNRESKNEKSIFWTMPSYSKAWWLLAVVQCEEGRHKNAILCLEKGLEIEPDHPQLWIEKGYLLNRLQRHQEALECYQHAAVVRSWAPKSQIARAFRGQGSSLIDLGRLDDAEIAYRKALELEPDNINAKKELDYISHAQQEQARAKETVPWFLDSLIHPPTDPLTIRLLALVEDLESIPGPKTVGSENYSKVAQAFLNRGWAGFEEAFDSIVPRTRSDYVEIKRDLLRESIFNRKTHLNMARVMSGKATTEEVWEEIARQKDSVKLQ
jgi:tetratricopeptide (TPR) repeat protein